MLAWLGLFILRVITLRTFRATDSGYPPERAFFKARIVSFILKHFYATLFV